MVLCSRNTKIGKKGYMGKGQDKPLSFNENPRIKKAVNTPAKSPMASPAEAPNRQTLNAFFQQTVVIGPSKTVVITLSTGTMMKTVAGYAKAMVRKTLHACGALPLALSNPKACEVSRGKCDNSRVMCAWSLIICE